MSGPIFIVQARAADGYNWEPAIQGTLNQTGESDEEASTFDDCDQAHAALEFVRAEHPRWQVRVRTPCPDDDGHEDADAHRERVSAGCAR